MDTFFLSIAVFLIPLGFTMLIVGIQSGGSLGGNSFKTLGASVAAVGLLCLCVAFYFVRQRHQDETAGRELLRKQLKAIFDELKGLRQDLKGGEDKNDRKDNPDGRG